MSLTRERSARAAKAAWRDPAFVGLASLAWVMLVASRGVIETVPLRRITAMLGEPGIESAVDDLPRHRYRRVRRIRLAIALAAPRTPTTSNCYPQALTAHALLRFSGLSCTVYYGARFDDANSALDTHVWVRSGPYFVTGSPEHRRYAQLGSYTFVPRHPRLPVGHHDSASVGAAPRTPGHARVTDTPDR